MSYYTENSAKYIEDTFNLDMSEQYNLFMKYVPRGTILDLGFG